MKRLLITILAITIAQSLFSQQGVNEPSLEYEAVSRGFYKKITVNKETLVFRKDRDGKKDITIKMKNKEWKELVDLTDKIKLEKLSTFKASSEKRELDGAAYAKLKVFINGNSYESSHFDHGNPPLEIKNLVEYVITLSESIEKS
ncbi:hypothetical protein [Aquimarina megaterium]|uniref:hypothetical protein n=1 Tax=Aquimarina megaterium TaxID=1443666 RepID=UPI00046FD163|nr:hypothetical protein [Aquimarina megaterium]